MTRRTAALATAAGVLASVAVVPLLSADAAVQPAARSLSYSWETVVDPRPNAATFVPLQEHGNPLSRTNGLFVDPQLPAARWVATHPDTKWVSTFATAIGVRPAIVILEPDALGDFSCMSGAQITTRLRLLNAATRMLAEKAPNTWTYIDAGHANWSSPATIAERLLSAGVARVRGFSVNVSNFVGTADSRRYAERVKAALRRPAGYVVDTSRNGKGGNGKWCNPSGRKLGKSSTTDPAALELWIKNPGNSDGRCGVAPSTKAGAFSPALAHRLITGR